MIDEQEISRAISILKSANEVFEVRCLYGKKVWSGYFKDSKTLIAELKKLPSGKKNVYLVLNKINEACYSRSQRDKFELNPQTTSDTDIEWYKWMMIDLDPKRPANTSSSDTELKSAMDLAKRIYDYLMQLGFSKPLAAKSGNGVHILCKIKLGNTKENVELMKNCLASLGLLFSNDEIDIDLKTFNPARICKLYGTMAEKGSDTKERPFRMAKILSQDNEYQVTDKCYLEKLANAIPKEPEKPQQYNNYMPSDFNLTDWMDKQGILYKKASSGNWNKYILNECPFDSSHNGKDACIFQSPNGAIGFHCFHNSCAGKTWQDVRLKYEPNAYEKKYQNNDKIMYKSFNKNKAKQVEQIIEKDGKPIFYTAMDVFELPKPEATFVKTGIIQIDKRLRGLKKGYVSLWSGLRGSAKSTILSEIALNAVDIGNTVGIYSGELTEKNFFAWMDLQAAGKRYAEPDMYEGYYNVARENQKRIASWLGNKLWLYNNEYGHDYVAIRDQFEKAIEEKNLDLLILDNLMSFDLKSLSYDKWESQTQFVLDLQRVAKKTNVHIAFVAHPRKSQGFLRLEDVSGTGDLTNAVDNAFIVHRNNHDFQSRTKEEFGWKEDNDVYKATNIVEICKDRDGGTQDYFVPLWYEVESKRLKNSESENVLYGWLDADEREESYFEPIEDDPFGE